MFKSCKNCVHLEEHDGRCHCGVNGVVVDNPRKRGGPALCECYWKRKKESAKFPYPEKILLKMKKTDPGSYVGEVVNLNGELAVVKSAAVYTSCMGNGAWYWFEFLRDDKHHKGERIQKYVENLENYLVKGNDA